MDIVFDASTLILLAKIDLLTVITALYNVIISDKVRNEVLAYDTADAIYIRYMISKAQISVSSVKSCSRLEKLMADFRIHAGEAEALALAIELSTPLAVDDGSAIRACKVIGIRFITAVHFVINSAQTGAVSQESALEKLKKLAIFGRYKMQIMQDAEKRILEVQNDGTKP